MQAISVDELVKRTYFGAARKTERISAEHDARPAKQSVRGTWLVTYHGKRLPIKPTIG